MARQRAARSDLSSVKLEFKQLQIEWIDLPTASVDAIVCRWAYMLTVDPAAGMREARRVLVPSGRIALAVWDGPRRTRGPRSRPMRSSRAATSSRSTAAARPGIFSLADPQRLQEMIEEAGFVDVLVESIELTREYGRFDEFWDESLDLSPTSRRRAASG